MKLTEKQKRFADYYIQTGNAEESARQAGYSARGNTTKLLQNTTIREYIDKRMAEKDKERIASQDEILVYLTQVMRGEMKEETLRGLGKGYQEIEDIDVSAKDRIKAAELLGKRYAMWTDKQQLDGSLGVTIIDDLGDGDEC